MAKPAHKIEKPEHVEAPPTDEVVSPEAFNELVAAVRDLQTVVDGFKELAEKWVTLPAEVNTADASIETRLTKIEAKLREM